VGLRVGKKSFGQRKRGTNAQTAKYASFLASQIGLRKGISLKVRGENCNVKHQTIGEKKKNGEKMSEAKMRTSQWKSTSGVIKGFA